jgi:hypothetical protein
MGIYRIETIVSIDKCPFFWEKGLTVGRSFCSKSIRFEPFF